MGKRCKKLEKDGAQWRQKWEGANRALIEMAEEVGFHGYWPALLLQNFKNVQKSTNYAQKKSLKFLEYSHVT